VWGKVHRSAARRRRTYIDFDGNSGTGKPETAEAIRPLSVSFDCREKIVVGVL
jgi:hypothetical protein